MVVAGPKTVFGGMHIPNPQLPLVKDAETIHEIYLAVPYRLYLRSGQYHARIVFVFDEIIVISRSVLYLAAHIIPPHMFSVCAGSPNADKEALIPGTRSSG